MADDPAVTTQCRAFVTSQVEKIRNLGPLTQVASRRQIDVFQHVMSTQPPLRGNKYVVNSVGTFFAKPLSDAVDFVRRRVNRRQAGRMHFILWF